MATAVNNKLAGFIEKAQTKIDAIPARQYYMALALSLLLAIKFVVMPFNQVLSDQQAQLQRLADTLKSPELLAEQVEQMDLAVAAKESEQASWLTSFYTGSQSQVKIEVANKLKSTTQEKGLLFLSSRWVNTSKKLTESLQTIEPLSYQVTVRGDYNQIKALIREWQAQKPLINVTEMRIRDQRQEGVASVRLKLLVYRVKSQENS